MSEPEFLRATRASYDAMAVDYANWIRDELTVKPVDRGLLAAFADLVQATGADPIADIGCGPGRVTAHLHSLGLPVFGIDLSPRTIALARHAHPELRFEVGSMLALNLADGALGGIVAWYSIIHVPQERLPDAFSEFHRVRHASRSCSTMPGWSCALSCCGRPMTTAISPRRHHKRSCWPANRPWPPLRSKTRMTG